MQYVAYNDATRDQWNRPLISCYRDVFAAPPWNEDWWTDGMVQDILDAYAGPNATIILAIEGEQVIGFAWGAVWESHTLACELELPLPYHPRKWLGYIKDVGVVASHRHRGIARSLLRELKCEIERRCPHVTLLLARTLAHPEPSVVYLWFPAKGFRSVAWYPEACDRAGQVILAAPFATISF